MTRQSITSTDTFAARAQRSEATRLVLWIAVLTGMLILTIARREAGGMVMSSDAMFYPYAGTLGIGIVVQLFVFRAVRRANRAGTKLPDWIWRATTAFDLAIAAGLLVIAAFHSPRGPVTALSAPPILLLPLLVLTSILRLRPSFTLISGLAGALIHALLTVRAAVVTDTHVDPVYLTYSGILALTAIAGMFVAREIRRHVREAADEAMAHEKSERQVFGMQRDLSVAREIQLGLLPGTSPNLSGFDIFGMNRPCDQTGGDYYDWQPLPDGKLAVVMADVSGHGIGPALVMAICRAYSRASAPMINDPSAMLRRLNELLHGDLPADRFITFALAILDQTGDVQLVSAGHGPTLLYRPKTNELLEFGGDGMPLGINPLEEYGPITRLTLDENDVLVLLTDGFFEWSRPGDDEQFGIARLKEALRANATRDAAGILRAIDESICTFCHGTPQSDDMTAIVIKRVAPRG